MPIKKLILFFAVLIFTAPLAISSSLQVSPILIELLPNQKESSLEVGNTGEQPSSFQIKAFRWKNVLGSNRLEDTKDVTISPTLIDIEPGQKKNISITIAVPPDPYRGAVYRLGLQEISTSQENLSPIKDIKSLLNVTIPLVLSPKSPMKPQAKWTLRHVGENKYFIAIHNTGEGYIPLREIALKREGEKRVLFRQPITYYVIPNAKKEFELKLHGSLNNKYVEIEAKTDHGDMQAKVQVTSN